MNTHAKKNALTLDGVMRNLRQLAHQRYTSQPLWLAAFFRSYHTMCRGAQEAEYLMEQAAASRLMTGKQPMPRSMYIHYTTQPELLRRDMEEYISDVTSTARQRQLHINTLRQMVRNASNLVLGDKDYILDYTTAAESEQLEELLYRMIYILIHEPGSNTMAA